MQKIRELLWLDKLHCFANELATLRKQPLEAVELDLYELVKGLWSSRSVLDKLRLYPPSQLTHNEWEAVYDFTLLAGQKARLVLADRHHSGCEHLAPQFNCKPLAFCFATGYYLVIFMLTSLL